MRDKRPASWFVVLSTVLSVASVAVVRRASPPTRLVIITLDTTRADHLSIYGNASIRTPHLEQLARDSTVFDRALSVAPLTLPAHCSLFTGLYPPHHGVRDNTGAPLGYEHITLAERLQARGFRTAAFVASAVFEVDRGLAQGFDQYISVSQAEHEGLASGQRRGDSVVNDAISWIAENQQSPLFMWVHLYDPHRPYDAPEPFRSAYEDPYDAEIAFADAQVGRVIDALVERKLLDETVVVIAGDHGESLGEHGERDHGIFVYNNVLRVPLIIRTPRTAARRVMQPVRLIDVMPTVLELLRMPAAPADGVSLLGMMHGNTPQPELDAYSESMYPRRYGWSRVQALQAGRYKLIDSPRPELYDLERDPSEQQNVFEKRRAVAAALATRLAMLSRGESSGRAPESSIAADLRHRLASLGYVSAHASIASEDDRTLPDPKDCIQVLWRDPWSRAGQDGPVDPRCVSRSSRVPMDRRIETGAIR
jgi:arylsulfatase A-like enzyme